MSKNDRSSLDIVNFECILLFTLRLCSSCINHGTKLGLSVLNVCFLQKLLLYSCKLVFEVKHVLQNKMYGIFPTNYIGHFKNCFRNDHLVMFLCDRFESFVIGFYSIFEKLVYTKHYYLIYTMEVLFKKLFSCYY